MDEMQAVIYAVRHEARRRILCALRDQPEGQALSLRQLSYQLKAPLSNVSYHTRVLAQCDVIRLAGTQPVHGSVQHFYEPTELMGHPVARAALAAEPGAE